MTWIYYLDLFGTAIFAISGTLTAIHKKFDVVGTLVIGFVTAIGGGTLRDLMIGRTPVGWMLDYNYILVILIAYLISYVFKSHILKLRKSMFLFDSIGIALFTILGIQTAQSFDLNITVCLILGVISAVFGGVIRDVLSNVVPLIFRREIYATACVIGGVTYLLLDKFLVHYPNLNIAVSIAIVLLIRYISVKRKWSLNY